MNINVFGAIFLDIYIYGNRFDSEVMESIGGSGLSIALGLHTLGHEIRFYGNIGNDERKTFIFNNLKKYEFSTKDIKVHEGKTGLFISKEDKVLAVERGVNDNLVSINIDNGKNFKEEYAVITTELNKESIEKILSYSWKGVFLDIGPRPQLAKDLNLPQNTIVMGTYEENEVVDCDIIKLGSKGAKWGDSFIEGNKEKLPYTIGAGDLFDTILIHNILSNNKKDALRQAVTLAEKACTMKGGFKISKL